MELEVQRKRLEQQLLKEQERVEQQVEKEMGARMEEAERASQSYTELLHKAETNIQALEESLAEACQLGLEADWQREVEARLREADDEQKRKREKLEGLHRQTLEQEERLVHIMRDLSGKKRDEAMSLRAEQREPPSSAHTDQTCLTGGLPHGATTAVMANGVISAVRDKPATFPRREGTNVVCFNSSPQSESTVTKFFLDRAQLDIMSREKLNFIGQVRQKVAANARESSTASSLCL